MPVDGNEIATNTRLVRISPVCHITFYNHSLRTAVDLHSCPAWLGIAPFYTEVPRAPQLDVFRCIVTGKNIWIVPIFASEDSLVVELLALAMCSIRYEMHMHAAMLALYPGVSLSGTHNAERLCYSSDKMETILRSPRCRPTPVQSALKKSRIHWGTEGDIDRRSIIRPYHDELLIF